MSNGFIYVVDAYFIDKIEGKSWTHVLWARYEQFTINFFTFFFFKSVGKHLKSVGGRRIKNSVDYRVNR